jgi:hypothetical protein
MTHARKWWLMLFAIFATTCGSQAARADLVYDFVTESYTGLVGSNNGISYDGSGFTGLAVVLTFTNAGVATGEISGFETNDFPSPDVFGLDGFVGMTVSAGGYSSGATLGTLSGSLALDVTFDPSGNISSDSIQFSDNDISFDLEGGFLTVSSDGAAGCLAPPGSNACTANGYFEVPEPRSFAWFLSSVLGCAALRVGTRRRTTLAAASVPSGLA